VNNVLQVWSTAFHRNGVGGAPFGVVLFTPADFPERRFVGIVFGEKDHVAVLDVTLLAQDDIQFMSNSWRGDYFEDELVAALEAADNSPRPEPEPGGMKEYEVHLAIHEYVTTTVRAYSEDEAQAAAEVQAARGDDLLVAQGSDIETTLVEVVE